MIALLKKLSNCKTLRKILQKARETLRYVKRMTQLWSAVNVEIQSPCNIRNDTITEQYPKWHNHNKIYRFPILTEYVSIYYRHYLRRLQNEMVRSCCIVLAGRSLSAPNLKAKKIPKFSLTRTCASIFCTGYFLI